MNAFRFVLSLSVLALLLVGSGCSLFNAGENDPSLPAPIDFSRFSQAPPLLVGRWELRRSIVFGPGEPRTTTPSTTRHTETLVFPSPPDSVRVYRSDTLYQHTSRVAFSEDVIKWGVRDDTLATSSAALDGPEKSPMVIRSIRGFVPHPHSSEERIIYLPRSGSLWQF